MHYIYGSSSQGYEYFVKTFGFLAEDALFQPFITCHKFRSINVVATGAAAKVVGYISSVFVYVFKRTSLLRNEKKSSKTLRR